MKNEDLSIMPNWENLVQSALNWEIGLVKTHEDIAKILLVKPSTTKYYNMVNLAISRLTKLGVRLANVKGEGYKRITADEWYHEAKRKMQKGGDRIKEAMEIINNAPYLEMSEEIRNETIVLHDLLIKQKYLLSGGVVKMEVCDKKIYKIREGSRL